MMMMYFFIRPPLTRLLRRLSNSWGHMASSAHLCSVSVRFDRQKTVGLQLPIIYDRKINELVIGVNKSMSFFHKYYTNNLSQTYDIIFNKVRVWNALVTGNSKINK
jgi:hypothetical protein